jgi:hypothetical protein
MGKKTGRSVAIWLFASKIKLQSEGGDFLPK